MSSKDVSIIKQSTSTLTDLANVQVFFMGGGGEWAGGVMMTPSRHPLSYEQLLPLPNPYFKRMLERLFNDPLPPPPHFKHFSLLHPAP